MLMQNALIPYFLFSQLFSQNVDHIGSNYPAINSRDVIEDPLSTAEYLNNSHRLSMSVWMGCSTVDALIWKSD